VQGKRKRNNVAQQGRWRGKEREIMWHSRVGGEERREK
jgi:hypothetical protein